MEKLLKSDNFRHLLSGLLLSFVVALIYLLSQGIVFKKAIFALVYFWVTPFLALLHVRVVKVFFYSLVLVILVILFKRVSSCMRTRLRWAAYMFLSLHWMAFGMYCATAIAAQ